MRAALHSWITLGALACAAPPTAAPQLAPTARTMTAASSVRPEVRVRPWPRFAELGAWPTVGERPLRSTGHGWPGRYEISVRVTVEARRAYEQLAPGDSLAPGTVIAASHRLSDGTAGPVFVMEKTAKGWRYLALDAAGVPEGGGTSPCERCHAEGRSDSLFGLPQP